MTVRVFVIGVLITSVATWGIWLLIINWLDPATANWLGFILFFLATFLAVASTGALIGYGVRRLISPGQLPAYRVRSSLRQGVWLGLFVDLLLLLQLVRLLRWWLTVIVIILFLSIELLFLSYVKSSRPTKANQD